MLPTPRDVHTDGKNLMLPTPRDVHMDMDKSLGVGSIKFYSCPYVHL
jgi:hypothetical protein